jgi:hypothetical protein
MQRSANPAGPSLGIEAIRDRERIGVDFDDASQSRTAAIDRFDPYEVFLGERSRGVMSRAHAILQIADRCFFEVERRSSGRLRRERRGGKQGDREQDSAHPEMIEDAEGSPQAPRSHA